MARWEHSPLKRWSVIALLVIATVLTARAGYGAEPELLVETPDGVSAGCGATLWPRLGGALLIVHRGPCALFRDSFEGAP